MPLPVQDYALIGDLHSAALVGTDGSIDWLCLPRFDSEACFAALLGEDRHGHWRIGPADGGGRVRRRYRHAGAHCIVSGSQALWLFGPVHVRRVQGVAAAEFSVSEGDRVPFALVGRNSRESEPDPPLVPALIDRTVRWWQGWVAGLTYHGEWRDAVIRSLITIKALTYAPTGGAVAAPTTSLPQQASGGRNWDYRYCWLRDAAATTGVLLRSGALGEAAGLLDWMTHAVAGPPSGVQDLYGVGGERRLPEIELDWLPGYEGARPVRIGNAATAGPPLDAFGEVLSARLAVRMAGLPGSRDPWDPDEVIDLLESRWREPDAGIWEVRGPLRQFVHSKIMVWAATFVQAYAGASTDASLLRTSRFGFLPPRDERLRSTVAAVARNLDRGGVLLRYGPEPGDSVDGMPPGDGGYVPATFWLAQCLAAMGRGADARQVFTHVLALRNETAVALDPLSEHVPARTVTGEG